VIQLQYHPSRSCRCGNALVRPEGSPPGSPWRCRALFLGCACPGTQHDEREADADGAGEASCVG
jgi:hypothetical protein